MGPGDHPGCRLTKSGQRSHTCVTLGLKIIPPARPPSVFPIESCVGPSNSSLRRAQTLSR